VAGARCQIGDGGVSRSAPTVRPSPACGGGLGWGCLRELDCPRGESPHPPRSDECVDLPRKRERCSGVCGKHPERVPEPAILGRRSGCSCTQFHLTHINMLITINL